MPTEVDNPFVGVYQALWDLAEASELVTSLVRPGNRIKFDQTNATRNPLKTQVTQTDLPELILVPTATEGNLTNDSCNSKVTKSFDWVISTGDMSILNILLPVEWAVFTAMTRYKEVLNDLTWQGAHFCKVTRLAGINHGFTDPERNRGIVGWSSVWGVSVEMHLSTAALREVGRGSGS